MMNFTTLNHLYTINLHDEISINSSKNLNIETSDKTIIQKKI